MKQTWFLVLFGLIGSAIACASDFGPTVAEATFHIGSADEGGTCFFVRPPGPDTALYLVTAAHVFEALESAPATVRLRERHADGSYEQPDYSVVLRREGERLWVRHASEDVGVLRVSDPLPVSIPALPFSVLADEAHFAAAGLNVCSPVFVLTYPAGFPARKGGFALVRPATLASYPLLPVREYPTYAASFTTFGGDSGGPVFVAEAEGRPLLIGVVVGAFRQDESVKKEFEESTMHHPFGVGLVVHAQLVRELIEQAARQAGSGSKKKLPSPESTGEGGRTN